MALGALMALSFHDIASAEGTHVVLENDTLSGIALRHGVSTESLADANGIDDENLVVIGQNLVIPGPHNDKSLYIVKSGDALSLIAARHGVSANELVEINQLQSPDQLAVGQTLIIPKRGQISPLPSLRSKDLNALNKIRAKKGRWKYIVIHHSGSKKGSAKSMDRYHREKRRMENGLAYHFVIGNGRGMGDGEIAIGHRWKGQLNGGHVASEELNTKSIGICLVGHFEEGRPTPRQMKSLAALTGYLMKQCSLRAKAVQTHQEINTKPTKCPGKHFPMRLLQAQLKHANP